MSDQFHFVHSLLAAMRVRLILYRPRVSFRLSPCRCLLTSAVLHSLLCFIARFPSAWQHCSFTSFIHTHSHTYIQHCTNTLKHSLRAGAGRVARVRQAVGRRRYELDRQSTGASIVID